MMSFNDIAPGTILVYKLRSVDRPTNPDKMWRGKVIQYNSCASLAVVTLLEEGYEGLEDWVWREQIVGLESVKKFRGYQTYLPLLFGVKLNLE